MPGNFLFQLHVPENSEKKIQSSDFSASTELERKLVGISDEGSERVKTFEDGKQK